MTDRRPDIHCDGCGKYSHSLSHKSWEQEFPEHPFYCGDCQTSVDQGIKTGKMVNFEWDKECRRRMQDFTDSEEGLSKLEKYIIGSFTATMRSDESFEGKIYALGPITSQEWQEISLKKLEYYKRYCDEEKLEILNKFISGELGSISLP